MIVVLERGASDEQCTEVLRELERLGLEGRPVHVLPSRLIHVVAGPSRRARKLRSLEGVAGLVPTPGPRIRARGRHFFPYHLINWLSLALLVLGVLVALAGFLPPGVGPDVERTASLAAAEVPWYLRAPHAFLAHGALGRLVLVVSALLLFFLPLLDRSQGATGGRAMLSRGLALAASLLLLAVWLFLTVVPV